ncbi:uncharacterized protein [Halyomorpha halys]|uniref:uncharacterized protein n=1 Tax=Halyomorpha halys TaxID=286706 RepID=UPI0006D50AE8|nr:titin-like [Halyomorpha halys]XP_014285142.1 titin-like [Halyomorpha halys]
MCDQTEVSYLPNDVVWVKLSNVWWPAQVQDETKLDEDVTSGLRKKPLAVVKFFDEDSYEFPKNLNQIYHYNCFKKEEFIKKGLDLCRPSGYREVSENMKKFPLDIRKAEILTGGNPDIINDPKYQPEEKFDYREQFGLKPRKKTSLGLKLSSSDSTIETPKQSRVKFSTPISAPSTSKTPEMKISNSTKSFSNPVKRLSTVKRFTSGINENFDKENNSLRSSKQYHCSYCNYTCGRMGVIIEHYRCHYRGLILPLPTQIPQNYCQAFQTNFIKRKDCVSSSPNTLPKYASEKGSVKRKSVEDSAPIKKRKYESTKKEKISVPVPGSSLAIPVKDIVGSAATPKKRPRKSKDAKSAPVKEPEALDILKDWEDDLEEEVEIDLTVTENDEVKDTTKNITDNLPEKEVKDEEQLPQQQEQVQDHKSPASKEKCCFDFEDNDESLNLNKSLKFGQKLPRVITEEKPNVQRLLKELQESKESPLIKEESMNEDFNEEIENLLKNTEVPKLPGIPKTSVPKPIDKFVTEDSSKPEIEITERKDLSKGSVDKVSSEDIDIQSEDSSSMIQSVTSSQTTAQEDTVADAFTDSKSDSAADSPSEAIKKNFDVLHESSEEKNVSHLTMKSTSGVNTSISESTTDKDSSDLQNFDEKEYLTQEACSSKDILMEDISRNESKSSSNESGSQLIINNDVDGADTALPSTTVESSLNKENMKDISEKNNEIIKASSEQEVSNIVEDGSTPMEVEVDSHEEVATPRAEEVQGEQNVGLQSIENISISETKISNENNDESLKEKEVTEKQSELNQSPIDDTMKIQVVTSSVKNDKTTKFEPSTSSDTQTDQIPFDINSMPIVIDQDPIMEIMEGHVEPLPNADVVRLYIRNSGEEEPEDFQSPRRLLTVSPPPPNLPPIPGIKKVPLPPPKNKNGANSSNKISGNTSSGSSTRYTLSKQPSKNTSQVQQPKILFIKSTSGAPGKLLIPQQQSSIFAQAGKLQPGTRILTTNPQLVSKGSVQKKVTPKSIVVGKQGFPTTAKVVPKSVIGQVIQKVSQQPIICNKNTSTVLVNSPKTIVNRSVGRNVLLSSQQLKTTTTAMQVTGAKVVRTAQIVKTPGTVFQQAETVLPQKVVQSTSALNENKKQTIKNKQLSPNILQRTQRKVSRQQVIKKSQLLTIPSSVQHQPAEVVTVNNLPIVQSIGSHSSTEPVKMLYLVDNSQYTVENPVIPVENDNQNIYVTSTSSSGNIDNIIFSIDGTANFVNISNDTATSSSTHVPSQDILAKALANTQVLQSETSDIVDSESTVFVDQQFQAPSLSNTVLETSLTLNQPPIMTPLEVPSSIAPQSSVSHIIPITNITKKTDIQQPSMPLLTDDVDVPGNTVFLSDTSAIPTTSGHLTFQLVHDNNLVVSSGIMQEKTLKLNSDSKEDNVLPEFLKGNFGSKSDIPKKETSPKSSER